MKVLKKSYQRKGTFDYSRDSYMRISNEFIENFGLIDFSLNGIWFIEFRFEDQVTSRLNKLFVYGS